MKGFSNSNNENNNNKKVICLDKSKKKEYFLEKKFGFRLIVFIIVKCQFLCLILIECQLLLWNVKLYSLK